MLHVTLADTVITVEGWTASLQSLGAYVKSIRKDPEELKAERKRRSNFDNGYAGKICMYRTERGNVIEYDGKSTAYFLPGLWPRVKRHLDENEIEYDIKDLRDQSIRPEPDYSCLDGISLREKQDVALALLASSDCGIIDTPTAFGKSFLISLLCQMYPTLNIVCTTGSTSVVHTLYEYLCKTCPGEVGLKCAGTDTTNGKRIVCTTLKSLPNINAERVHLLLVDECHALGDNDASRACMEFKFARRFGFSASPKRSDGTGLVMESVVGPVILKMSYQEAVDAGSVTPMKYYMIPVHQGADYQTDNDVVFKRSSYWRNYYRNNAIKNLVYEIKRVYDGQILIMVNTLEHAIRLHMLLPWFKVVYYGATKSEMDGMRSKFSKREFPNLDLTKYRCTKKELEIARCALAKGTLRYVISTKVLKQGVNLTHLAVLFRADGDVSEVDGIQIPGRLARLDEGKEYAYLIDCMDTFNDRAMRRSKSRQKQYQDQKWTEITKEELLNDLSRISKADSD